MLKNTGAKKIIILAIIIVLFFLILNLGLIIRINQLSKEIETNNKTIKSQQETIERYSDASSTELDETSNIQ